MIRLLTLAHGPGTYPYPNFGMEEYLLYHVEEEECILYLWQNEKTVVIGRNQNAWKECRREELEAAGGHLVRRLSGGGAVFHDLGNLNFTFITRKENYDVTKQTEVILRAVKKLGIHAERTGRNDITAEGRKFSGNAYYETGDFCCHHGTILLSVDKEEMARYLNVSREKLKSKSVDSVRSRVTNLCEFVPDLTVRRMGQCLEENFGEVYGLPVRPFPPERMDESEAAERTARFASWDWKYGRKIPFSDESAARFSWGEVQVLVLVEQGRVREAKIWSDALDTDFIKAAEEALGGMVWSRNAAAARFSALSCVTLLQETMRRDLQDVICNMIER
ncbi:MULTISPECIES: lipoate--protein ligase [Hungatella]|uniref:lipoate--protein ligase n=1 Tax=Hungatella hathewayi TaxID=154046 RepID=A0AAW9WDR5_9FIRM|nr:lipoate--protein ligase [Hungatella hathewayi]MCQ4827359.1 lipoate--protein ligase [Hungatella sp. SL.1.14]MUB61472.1 lipoate--protein ligase [Hungatella hathewayi]